MSRDCANCGHSESTHKMTDGYQPYGHCNYGWDLCGCKEFVAKEDKLYSDKLAQTVRNALTDASWPENSNRTTPQQGMAALDQLLKEKDSLSKLRFYRTVITLKQVTEDVFEVEAGGASFTTYLRRQNVPTEYLQALEDADMIWTFGKATIGADYPEEMEYSAWETDNIATKPDIDAMAERMGL